MIAGADLPEHIGPLGIPGQKHHAGVAQGGCRRSFRFRFWFEGGHAADLALPDGVAAHVARYDDAAALNRLLESLPHDDRTAIALLSHMFDVDSAWLTALLPLPVAYIGVLGSRKRAGQLLEAVNATLGERGLSVTDRMRHRLHAPIGLDLGGESPASIALSAIAEIEAVIHGRPAGFLRERLSPIHARTPTPRVFEHEAPIVPTECDTGRDDGHDRG